MINQNFLIDQNIKNFIYDANYQPIKECAVRPADISDGLNKGNSCQ